MSTTAEQMRDLAFRSRLQEILDAIEKQSKRGFRFLVLCEGIGAYAYLVYSFAYNTDTLDDLRKQGFEIVTTTRKRWFGRAPVITKQVVTW